MTVAQSTVPAPAAGAPAVGAGTASPAGGRPPSPRRRRGGSTPFLLLFPAVLILAVVIGWPLIQLFVMSFQEYGRAQVFGQPAEFIGLGNYVEVLGDEKFWNVLGRSVALCVACVVLTVTMGTAIALLMQRLTRFFRSLVGIGLLLAWAMPALSATIVWGWIVDTQYGVLNYVLTQITGTDFRGHSWLTDPVSFFAVATVIIVWGAIPFVVFTVYAGLTQVSEEMLEAAQLDGANAWQRFWGIIVPSLRSIFLVVIVLSVIWDMRVFTQIYALQAIGGSISETTTIGVYIYQVSTGSAQYGIGGAIAVILVVLLGAVSVVAIRNNLKEEEK